MARIDTPILSGEHDPVREVGYLALSVRPEASGDLVARQKELIASTPGGIVAEGRDITTVVAPDADVRVLLVADPQARDKRFASVSAKAQSV